MNVRKQAFTLFSGRKCTPFSLNNKASGAICERNIFIYWNQLLKKISCRILGLPNENFATFLKANQDFEIATF